MRKDLQSRHQKRQWQMLNTGKQGRVIGQMYGRPEQGTINKYYPLFITFSYTNLSLLQLATDVVHFTRRIIQIKSK